MMFASRHLRAKPTVITAAECRRTLTKAGVAVSAIALASVGAGFAIRGNTATQFAALGVVGLFVGLVIVLLSRMLPTSWFEGLSIIGDRSTMLVRSRSAQSGQPKQIKNTGGERWEGVTPLDFYAHQQSYYAGTGRDANGEPMFDSDRESYDTDDGNATPSIHD